MPARSLLIATTALLILLAGCQGGLPPTMFVMEVTRIVVVTATPAPPTTETPAVPVTPDATAVGAVPLSPMPTRTPAPTATMTPDIFPTPAEGRVYVVEQDFEDGRMFWLEPVDQIWVTTTDEQGNPVWSVYDDTFEEGMPERDEALTPPDGLQQPVRGFGKLWRENAEVRAKLGWALESEYGHVTYYEYHAGGTVTEDNQYIPAPGYHIIETLDQQVLRFNETDRTWAIVDNP